MQVISNAAAAAREHLVRRLYVSGERSDTICMHDTCTIILAHLLMSTCASDTQFAIFSRAGYYCEIVIVAIIACTNAAVLGSVGGVNHGRRCIADRHHPVRALGRLSALKGALAAAGSAQGGDLRRSRERHPRQGCRGRVRCDGAGSRKAWAAPRARSRSRFSSNLEDLGVHEIPRDSVTAGGHARP
jgi:hypothetical protein